MNKPIKYLTATVAIMLLSTVPVSAEVATQKKEPLCTSTESCEKLSHSIQAQVDELNKKLDTVKDSEIDLIFSKIEKLEQRKTNILISSKDIEIAEEKAKTQAAYVKVSEKLDAIEGSLKEK